MIPFVTSTPCIWFCPHEQGRIISSFPSQTIFWWFPQWRETISIPQSPSLSLRCCFPKYLRLQRSANIFCGEPDHRCFWFCGSCSLIPVALLCRLMAEATIPTAIRGCVPGDSKYRHRNSNFMYFSHVMKYSFDLKKKSYLKWKTIP